MAASPMAASPMAASPMAASPMEHLQREHSPMGASPMGASPMGASPMGASPMAASPMADISNGSDSNTVDYDKNTNSHSNPFIAVAIVGAIAFLIFVIALLLPHKRGRAPFNPYTAEGKPAVTKLTADDTYLPEVLRFISLSLIALTPAVFFFFVQSEFGTNSPIGLVKDSRDTNSSLTQWVINVGGNKSDNYSSGLQIPFYVFAFGIAGGY